MMTTILFVMIATGLGSVLRYIIMQNWKTRANYANGVFVVNAVGSFLLGMLISIPFSHELALYLETGFLGGLTTFSSMMTEGIDQDNRTQKVLYFAIQMGGGVLFFYLGLFVSTALG
ncbi:CrcB family protein [Fructobacillus sp. W13]|uniref:Fluoride-specific ion channel FluC n=1 Tax=Fructobacillus apis TaxID=2935017 RepID=A0ABT0ZQ97_9LACO|nr:CrcB family protein [Fructobacillus apis]MCO0832125.1 CrcB family protein [Fructobacillus apis]